MWAYKLLRTKHFHGVPSASPHAYSLKSRYGKVRRMLCWLDAEERRTNPVFSSNHHQLVQALPHAKGKISHSWHLLEACDLVKIGRSPGGQAENIRLTSAGCQKASDISGSYDEGVASYRTMC